MDEDTCAEHNSANGDVIVNCTDDSVTDVIEQTPSDLPNQPSDSNTVSDTSMTSHLVSSEDVQQERIPPETTTADDHTSLSSPKAPKQMILFAVELMEAETEKLRDMNSQLAQELGQLRAENDVLRRELKRSHKDHEETKQLLTTESKRLRAELEHVVEENRKSQQASVQRCTEAESRIGELTNQLEREKEEQKRLELELERRKEKHVVISEGFDNLSGTQHQQKHSSVMTSSAGEVHASQHSTSRFMESARKRLDRSSVVDDDSQDRFLELTLEVKSLRSERLALRAAGERLERNSCQLAEEIVRLKSIIEDRESELKREAVRHGLLTRQFNSLLDENERLKLRHNVRTYSMSNLLTTSADVDGNGSTSFATATTTMATLSQSGNREGASLSRSITWSSSLHEDGSTAFRRSLSPSAQDSGQAFAANEQHTTTIRRAKQSHQRMLRGTNRSPTALVLPVTAGNSVTEHSAQETNFHEQAKKGQHKDTEHRRQNQPLNSRSLQNRAQIQTSASNSNGGTAADGELGQSYRELPSGRSVAVFDRLHAGRHGCKAEVVRQQQATVRQQRQTAPVKQQALHIQSVTGSATTGSRFVRSADAPAGTSTAPLFLSSTRPDAATDGIDTDFSSPSSTDSVSTDATLPAIGRSMTSFVKSVQMAAKHDLRRPPNS